MEITINLDVDDLLQQVIKALGYLVDKPYPDLLLTGFQLIDSHLRSRSRQLMIVYGQADGKHLEFILQNTGKTWELLETHWR